MNMNKRGVLGTIICGTPLFCYAALGTFLTKFRGIWELLVEIKALLEVKILCRKIFCTGYRTSVAALTRMEKENSLSHSFCIKSTARSMLDGQIHEAEKVAEIIAELTEEMRSITGVELKVVAAAGRSQNGARNCQDEVPRQYGNYADELTSLQLQAVQDAQLALPKMKNTAVPAVLRWIQYRGRTVGRDKVDHTDRAKGQEAEVDVVATFLPRIVIDSLQSAVESGT